MAQPITFDRNVNGAAHAEHADAVDSAFEVLQLLHDRGVLNLLRGLLGAGDRVVDTLVEAVDTPESIRAIRNFLLITKFFGNIRPEVLDSLVQAITEATQRETSHKAPGFFELYRRLRNEDTRHALAVTLDLMESAGKRL